MKAPHPPSKGPGERGATATADHDDTAPADGYGALRGLLLAGAFLTRLPFPVKRVCHGDHGWALAHFPLIGLLVGGILWGVAALAAGVGLTAGATAVLVCCAYAYVTGALHLDGVADVCDAAGGGRGDRQRMLAIMKDSRIGAHGATGLVLVLAARLVATAELATQGTLWPLLLAPTLARFVVTPAIAALPSARPDGLGNPFKHEATPLHLAIAAAWVAIATLPLLPTAAPPLAAAIVAAGLLCLWAMKHLHGLTGDIYGALIEAAEVTALLASTVS